MRVRFGDCGSAYNGLNLKAWPGPCSLGDRGGHHATAGWTAVMDSIRPLGGEELDRLKPLWLDLQDHHMRISPRLAELPKRSPEESWRHRRAKYTRWLESQDTFVLVSERGDDLVGYAFVTIGPGYASWDSGDRLGELETLSVAPAAHGQRSWVSALVGRARAACLCWHRPASRHLGRDERWITSLLRTPRPQQSAHRVPRSDQSRERSDPRVSRLGLDPGVKILLTPAPPADRLVGACGSAAAGLGAATHPVPKPGCAEG